MADLRKAVGEDVSRIVERIHRLSAGFCDWPGCIGNGPRRPPYIADLSEKHLGGCWDNFLLRRIGYYMGEHCTSASCQL